MSNLSDNTTKDQKENSDIEESEENPSAKPVFHQSSQTIEFSIDAIRSQLTCLLCQGFFRDPLTTVKCRHTFCRGCLGIAFSAAKYECPQCDTYLGADFAKAGVSDHVLSDLMDKALFPQLAKEDSRREKEFYEKRGIDPKLDRPVEGERPEPSRRKKRQLSKPRSTVIKLLPSPESGLAPLEYEMIRTESTLRIGQVKKYLISQLSDKESQLGASTLTLSCHDTPLGDDLTLEFVHRTVWREGAQTMLLVYSCISRL